MSAVRPTATQARACICHNCLKLTHITTTMMLCLLKANSCSRRCRQCISSIEWTHVNNMHCLPAGQTIWLLLPCAGGMGYVCSVLVWQQKQFVTASEEEAGSPDCQRVLHARTGQHSFHHRQHLRQHTSCATLPPVSRNPTAQDSMMAHNTQASIMRHLQCTNKAMYRAPAKSSTLRVTLNYY